jgi:hypothetical protein
MRRGAILIVLGVLLTLSSVGPGSVGPAVADDVLPTAPGDDGAARLLALINAERVQRDLAPITARGDVTDVARVQARAMADAGDIWHNDDYFTDGMRRRLDARTLGENVAMNKSVEDAHRRLMESPGHRANILDPDFRVAGIASARAADGTYFLVEDFLQPRSPLVSAVVPPATVTPAPAEPAPAPDVAPPATVAPQVPPPPVAVPVDASVPAVADVVLASDPGVPAGAAAAVAAEEAAVPVEGAVLGRRLEAPVPSSAATDRSFRQVGRPLRFAASLVWFAVAFVATRRSFRNRRAPAAI